MPVLHDTMKQKTTRVCIRFWASSGFVRADRHHEQAVRGNAVAEYAEGSFSGQLHSEQKEKETK